MSCKVSYDDQIDVVIMEVEGSLAAGEAADSLERVEELFEAMTDRLIVCDLTRAVELPKDARQILVKRSRQIGWDKMAFVVPHPVVRITAKIVVAAIGKSADTRFFSSGEEALAWLCMGS